jgi:hypothetical protein
LPEICYLLDISIVDNFRFLQLKLYFSSFQSHVKERMKNLPVCYLLALAAVIAGGVPGWSQDQNLRPVTRTIALRNAHIVTKPGDTIAFGTVVIRNGLIEAVGKNVAIPFDARIIDADSMYIHAGFIDGLSHVGIPKAEQAETGGAQGQRRGGQRPNVEDPGNPPHDLAGIQPTRLASEMISAKERSLADWRQWGFTAAHVAPEGGMFPGQGSLVLLSGGEREKIVLREPLSLYSTLEGGRGVYPATVIAVMSKWRELYQQARQAKAHEALYAKDPAGMARPEHDRVLQAFYPVIDGRMPVFFRAEDVKSAYRVLALRQDLGFPLTLVGLKQGWHLVDRLKAEKIPVLLALDLPEAKKKEENKKEQDKKEGDKAAEKKETKDPEVVALEKRRDEELKSHESQAAIFEKNGIAFGFASLSAKPREVRANLRRMIANGLSEKTALAALTTVPAQMMGVADRLGTVEKGKIANLVISDKPFFAEKSNVRFVIIDGQVFEYEAGAAAKPADPKVIASVAGRWSYKVEVPGESQQGTLTLRENNGVLEGEVSSEQAQQSQPIEGASIEDNRVNFSTRFDVGGGQNIVVEWNLTLDGDSLKGSVTVGQFGTFGVDGQRIGAPQH